MSYVTIGENRISLSHINRTFELGAVRLPCHNGLYVQSRYLTSTMRVFRENLIFSSLSAYSPILGLLETS
jgi:hypothetical protein